MDALPLAISTLRRSVQDVEHILNKEAQVSRPYQDQLSLTALKQH